MEWFNIADRQPRLTKGELVRLRRPQTPNEKLRRRTIRMRISVHVSASLLLALACVGIAWSAGSGRVTKQAFPGKSTTVVVAEGDHEPRSIGSYTIRIYGATNANFAFDDFIAGMVRPRDGAIEGIRFADLDRDGNPEVIVLLRSTGTGGYLSADAYRFRGNSLTLLATVSDLAKDADALHALQSKVEQSRDLPTDGKKSPAK